MVVIGPQTVLSNNNFFTKWSGRGAFIELSPTCLVFVKYFSRFISLLLCSQGRSNWGRHKSSYRIWQERFLGTQRMQNEISQENGQKITWNLHWRSQHCWGKVLVDAKLIRPTCNWDTFPWTMFDTKKNFTSFKCIACYNAFSSFLSIF